LKIMKIAYSTVLASLLLAPAAQAAPDEDKLGKARGYPAGNANTWFTEEATRVGSFTQQGEIWGIFNGKAHEMPPSKEPLLLPKASEELSWRWNIDQLRGLTPQDYLDRQRVMALLVIKDGQLVFEHYQYDRNEKHRFLSNSMAKSVTAIAIGLALREGKIKSLDERADVIAPALAGTLYGETTVRNLLRMASGARFEERYDGNDDLARYGSMATRSGVVTGAKLITERAHAQGSKFNYASAETDMLAVLLQAATQQSLSSYLAPRLWQPMGAESSALWRADRFGIERAAGNLNATARDWARLGWLLANDGKRPDKPELGEIIPSSFLLEATDAHQHEEHFKPNKATPYYGYGYQIWTFPGNQRRFALVGVYGQMIFVDPGNKLVMVHLAANATARTGQTSMGREADALWRGLVAKYGRW
jgi:CubicO group peptidase (beta-lactamase class C family)